MFVLGKIFCQLNPVFSQTKSKPQACINWETLHLKVTQHFFKGEGAMERQVTYFLRYHLSQKLISADILRDLYLWYFSLKALFFLQRMKMWYFLVGDYVVFFLYYMWWGLVWVLWRHILYCIVYFIVRFLIHDLKALKSYLQVKGKCPEWSL